MRAQLIMTLIATVMAPMATVWGRSIQDELLSRNVVPLAQIAQRVKRTPHEYGQKDYTLTHSRDPLGFSGDLEDLLEGYQHGYVGAKRMLNKLNHSRAARTGTDRT